MDVKYLIKENQLFIFVNFDSEISKEFFNNAKKKINNLNKEIITFSRKIGFKGKVIKVVIQGVVMMTITLSIDGSSASSELETEEIVKRNKNININKYFLDSKSDKYGNYMRPKYIVIHNTANSASSYDEIDYLHSSQNNTFTSFHFAVDDEEIWQALPVIVNGWHAGDGKDISSYNRKSIGIEIAKSTNHNDLVKDKAIDNAAKLTAYLINEHNIPLENVVTHNHASGKYCPHDIYDRYGWDNFIKRVSSYL
ncbi:N-acetylmuramoyl-L-alanine amidase [Mycoplasmatota bacterium zrk1]